MPQVQADYNAILNIGGALTHARAVSGGGGELVQYDSTPIGGPPSFNADPDVRPPLTFEVTTLVVGATQADRDTFVAKFDRGNIFDFVATPSGANQMYISGEPDALGKRFMVTSRNPTHTFQENSELAVTLTESGLTPAV